MPTTTLSTGIVQEIAWAERSRRFARVWREYKRGGQLSEEDSHLAACMTRHPEWESWWERAGKLDFDQVRRAKRKLGGISPFNTVSAESSAEALITVDPEVRKTYMRLRGRGLSDSAARAEIARACQGVFWQPEGDLQAHGARVMRQLRKGKTPEEMFPGLETHLQKLGIRFRG